jgi:hypothetical protein
LAISVETAVLYSIISMVLVPFVRSRTLHLGTDAGKTKIRHA